MASLTWSPTWSPTLSPTICIPPEMSVWEQYVLPMSLLYLLICGLSASVNAQQFWETLTTNKGVVVGLACQFVLMPFLGFISVLTFIGRENYPIGMTLLVVTSSPGGGFSNWWCSLFNADLALSIAMTSASTFLSIGFLPLNLLLYVGAFYGGDVSIHWGKFFISVGVTVSAVLSGILVSYRVPQYRALFNVCGQAAGILLILSSLFFGSSCKRDWMGEPALAYIGIAFPCVVGITLPMAITAVLVRSGVAIQPPERTAICVESAYQNIGIAQAFAMTVLEGKDSVDAIKVPLFYGAVEVVVIALFLLISWKSGLTLAPASDPLWKVITNSYQEPPTSEVEDRDLELSGGVVEVARLTALTDDVGPQKQSGSNLPGSVAPSRPVSPASIVPPSP